MRLSQLLAGIALVAASDAAQAALKPVTIVRFRADGPLMMVPVKIGAESAWFMFDTSSSKVIIDPRLSTKLGLVPKAETTTTGSGVGTVPVKILPSVPVEFGSVRFEAKEPWAVDLSKVPIDKDVRGALGFDLWTRYVVEIDPVNRTIILYEPATYKPSNKSTCLPLTVEKNKLFVEGRLDVKPGLSVQRKWRVDMAAHETVDDPILEQATVTQRSRLGGLGEDFYAMSGKADALHLGPFTIPALWGPAGGPTPSIGMEIFRRFVTTIDVQHHCMHLEPTPALSEPVPAPPPDR